MSDFNIPTELLEPKKDKRLENLKNSKKSEPKPEPVVESEKLPRVNRQILCIHCETEKILNPDQYQSYYDYWGDEDKIKRNFICKPCDMAIQNNPFRFYATYSELTRKFIKQLKSFFESYRTSQRLPQDVNNLGSSVTQLCQEYNFYKADFVSNCEYILDTVKQLPIGLRLKCMPYVGTIEFLPYETTEKVKFL